MKVNCEAIRTLLFRRRTTQTELAAKAGLARLTVSQVCNGKSCSLKTIVKIADALGVSLDDIIIRGE